MGPALFLAFIWIFMHFLAMGFGAMVQIILFYGLLNDDPAAYGLQNLVGGFIGVLVFRNSNFYKDFLK